jgi:hypothetical protein
LFFSRQEGSQADREGLIDIYIDGWTDGWLAGWIDISMDRKMIDRDRQTQRWIYEEKDRRIVR